MRFAQTVNGVEATPLVRRSLRERQDMSLRPALHVSAKGCWLKAGGGAAAESKGSPFIASFRILRRRPSTQSAYHPPSSVYRQGTWAWYRTGCSSTLVARIASLHPFTSVKAPGNGGATARTRS